MPRVVLLDLDDTLLDNRGAEVAMLDELGAAIVAELPAFDTAQLPRRFLELREPLFRHVLDGSWTHAAYREAHLRAIVEPWGEPSDALLAHGMALRDALGERLPPRAGAAALLRDLRAAGHELGLLTNGPAAMQRAKLERAGWTAAFDALGISEELGAAKPDALAFHRLLDRLGARPQEAVMVGDNLDNDVGGALGAGLRGAVWVRVDPQDPREPPPGVPVVEALADVPAGLDPFERMDA